MYRDAALGPLDLRAADAFLRDALCPRRSWEVQWVAATVWTASMTSSIETTMEYARQPHEPTSPFLKWIFSHRLSTPCADRRGLHLLTPRGLAPPGGQAVDFWMPRIQQPCPATFGVSPPRRFIAFEMSFSVCWLPGAEDATQSITRRCHRLHVELQPNRGGPTLDCGGLHDTVLPGSGACTCTVRRAPAQPVRRAADPASR